MAYSATTFGSLCSALATRLGDASSIYWRNASYGDELSVYVFEALRTWQAYSAFSRARCNFNLSGTTTWYDITSGASTGVGPQNPSTLIGPTVTDSQIVQAIQYHLIENANQKVTGAVWVGTSMFSLSSVTAAMQRTLDQFMQDTGCKISASQQVTNNELVSFSSSIIDLRRLAWIDPISGAITPLWRTSQFGSTAWSALYNITPGTPIAFDIVGESPLQLRLMPPPVSTGTLDMLTVNVGPTLNPAAGVIIGILDSLTPGIKWGALADLLSQEGQAHDPVRADYCQQRYKEFVEIARQIPVIIQAQINGVNCQTSSVDGADSFNPSWQTPPSGTQQPTGLLTAGLNLVAPCPQADATGPYSVAMDIVTNANIPVNNGAFVQLGQEQIEAIMNESVHLAAFKQGGEEFLDTIPLHQEFVREAGVYNDRLRGCSTYLDAVQGLSLRQDATAPRRQSDVAVTP